MQRFEHVLHPPAQSTSGVFVTVGSDSVFGSAEMVRPPFIATEIFVSLCASVVTIDATWVATDTGASV